MKYLLFPLFVMFVLLRHAWRWCTCPTWRFMMRENRKAARKWRRA